MTSGGSRVPVINYIRVPAGFALLLLLVWFPLILGLSAVTYRRASGLGHGIPTCGAGWPSAG